MARIAVVGSQAFALINFRRALMVAMVDAGNEVVAFAPDFDDAQRASLAALGIRTADYPLQRNGLNPLYDIRTVMHLRRLFRETGCEVFFAFTIKPVVYGMMAAVLAGVQRRFALITGLGYTLADVGRAGLRDRAISAVARLLYRQAMSSATGVFFQNKDDRDAFVNLRLVEPDKVLGIVPTGVDLAEWQAAAPHLDPPTFSLVGRMLLDKGVLEFIEAARIVRQRGPNVRFLLIGGLDSNPKALSRERLDDLTRDGTVQWIGHVPVSHWLQQTSVFVLPSYHEGAPRSTQEAMAMARPIITTDVPGCRDTVCDGDNGFLVPARNAEALAEAMGKFIADPGLIVRMGARSRVLAEDRFSVHKANARILGAMDLV